jgi:gas vesicle protein
MSSNGFVKGIAVGIVTGAAIGIAAAPRTKDAKRATGRFLRAAGEVIENISGIWS